MVKFYLKQTWSNMPENVLWYKYSSSTLCFHFLPANPGMMDRQSS